MQRCTCLDLRVNSECTGVCEVHSRYSLWPPKKTLCAIRALEMQSKIDCVDNKHFTPRLNEIRGAIKQQF